MNSFDSVTSLACERALERDLEHICNSMIKDLNLIKDSVHVDKDNIVKVEQIYQLLYQAETLLLRSRLLGNVLE